MGTRCPTPALTAAATRTLLTAAVPHALLPTLPLPQVGSLIIGVDLAAIKPIRGVKTILGDITTQQCRAAIRKEAGGSLMDVVLHDGARGDKP